MLRSFLLLLLACSFAVVGEGTRVRFSNGFANRATRSAVRASGANAIPVRAAGGGAKRGSLTPASREGLGKYSGLHIRQKNVHHREGLGSGLGGLFGFTSNWWKDFDNKKSRNNDRCGYRDKRPDGSKRCLCKTLERNGAKCYPLKKSRWLDCTDSRNTCCRDRCDLWVLRDRMKLHEDFYSQNECMVLPTDPATGVDSIDALESAQKWDNMWERAKNMICTGDSCRSEQSASEGCTGAHCKFSWATSINPFHARSRHYMHFHVKRLGSGGKTLKMKLEGIVGCSSTGQWKPVTLPTKWKCRQSKVMRLGQNTGPFSATWRLATNSKHPLGNLDKNLQMRPTLATIGITVFYSKMCTGHDDQIVLVHAHCALNYLIYEKEQNCHNWH